MNQSARTAQRVGMTTLATVAALALSVGAAVAAPRDDKALFKAAEVMRKVGTARITGTINGTITVEGLADFANGDGEMTITGLGGDPTAVTREIVVKNVVYVDLAGSPGSPLAVLGDGKPWLELGDITTLSGGGGGSSLPTFDLLRGAQGTEKVGRERIDGVPTTRYRVIIDPAVALEASPVDLRSVAELAVAAFGDAQVTSEVWLDKKSRVRRLSYTWVPGAGAAPGIGEATLVYDFSEFGVPVNIEAPPPDQVSVNAVFGE
jgi:hypothetical protein